MKTMWFALAGLPVLAAPMSVQAQSSAPVAGPVVRHVHVNAQGDRETFDRAAWRTKLAAQDLESRERAFDELVQLARRDDAARDALRAWSEAKDEPELAWTSRLALRELDRARGGAAWNRAQAPRFGGARVDPQDWTDLRERMEELQRSFGGMDSLFDELQQQMDELSHGTPLAPGQNGTRQSQSFALRAGPDGVEARVQVEENGKLTEKTYTAKSLDELYAAHPELESRIRVRTGAGDSFGNFGGNGRAFARGNRAPLATPLQPLIPAAPDTDPDAPRLGVGVVQLGDDDAKAFGLEAGHGLLVKTVQPGSLAEQLGVAAGDVLVELDDKPITSRDDVADVLRARKAGAELRATVVDAKHHKRTLTLKNPAEPTPAKDSSRRF